MKSVGEVMAIGRSFRGYPKAVRMLNIGADGLTLHLYKFNNIKDEVKMPPTDGYSQYMNF